MMKFFSLKLVFLSFLGMILILGAGCSSKPEDVIKEMQEKMTSIKTTHYNLSINVLGRGADITNALGELGGGAAQNDSEGNVNVELSGDVDMSDAESVSSVMKGRVTFASGGTQLTADFENRRIDDQSYIKFNQAPNLGFLNLNNLAGNWYRFDLSALTPEPTEETGQTLTEDQIKQIKKLIEDTNFFQVKEDLGAEKVNDMKAYHYLVVLGKEAVKNFVIEYNKIVAKTMSDEDMNSLQASLDKVGELKIELWIGTRDKLLYKAKIMDVKFKDPEAGTDVTIIGILNLSNFNAKVNVEKPADAKSSDELVGAIFGGALGNLNGFEMFAPTGDESAGASDVLDSIFPSGEGLPAVNEEDLQKQLDELNKMMNEIKNGEQYDFNQ